MPDGSPVPWDVADIRRRFPALKKMAAEKPAVYFDGPAGSQVPQRVIDGIGRYLTEMNANHGGVFATSVESDALLAQAHQAGADLVGADDPGEIAFGANMTTLTLAFSRALARTWQPADEIVLSRSDHDANVTPWVLAARDAGVEVKHIEMNSADGTLNMDDLRQKLSSRTRLVAVGCASNATGTIHPVAEIARLAHGVGAEVFLDAVHFAPHLLMDVRAWDCDYLACSAYKFFGPHVGLLWGTRQRMEALQPYKLRPSSDKLPERWMTGTQSHEGIAGTLEAIEYLAELGRPIVGSSASRRAALRAAFERIARYEQTLLLRLMNGLAAMPLVKVWGITDPGHFDHRVPTVSLTHSGYSARVLAERLAAEGIFAWHGNFYALPLTEALGLEPDGLLRIGLLHYNTAEEVDRLLAAMPA
ncbi:MAG: cysteine desulfurase-like protein [Pirellulales bacterium]